MKQITSIVLFASIFAVAVGTLGLSGISASSLMTAGQTPESVGMLGHVEYKVMDEFGDIKAYMQNDNVVVNAGKNCVSEYVFEPSTGSTCVFGAPGTNPFQFVGIGNGSSTAIGNLNQTLADGLLNSEQNEPVANCADDVAAGDMARRLAVVTSVDAVNSEGGTGTVVTIDTSTVPFTFDNSNDTAVIDSGVFNGDYATVQLQGHTCTVDGTAATEWNMFSRQLLNGATGITVTGGDSLSVKWTITVG